MKISYAVLHENIFVPEAGNINKTLVSQGTPQAKGTPMELRDDGFVELTVPIPNSKRTKKVLVPPTSFTHLVPEESNK